MKRDEVIAHCEKLGLKSDGPLGMCKQRVAAGYRLLHDLTGYGEMSKFGENVTEKIFNRFKTSFAYKGGFDSGMRLWDFNRFLVATGTDTLYDEKEYKDLTELFDLLVDKSGNLRVEGLKQYYLRNGRLNLDCAAVGMGSLDEHLAGTVKVSAVYEPDTLTSMLSLEGNNSLVKSR